MVNVYLDSQDYSTLSDNAKITNELRAVKEVLKRYASEGLVKFYFSSVAVCEVSPSENRAIPYAILRAELLSDLCGSNALLEFSKVLELEVTALMDEKIFSASVLDDNGNWFPDLTIDDEPPDLSKELLAMVRGDATLSREDRRALERSMFKNGRPTARTRACYELPARQGR